MDDGSRNPPKYSDLNYNLGILKILKLKENQGIEYALNYGLRFILNKKYDFIGRIDCGDLCKPHRFKKQVTYLRNNSNIALVGSWVNIIDSHGNHKYVLRHPSHHNKISKKMYLNSMFVHPSVVFRSCIINKIGFYPLNFKAAEDYAFFFKIAKQFNTANIEEALLDYIIDHQSISSQKRKIQVKSRIKIIWKHFYFGYYPIYGLMRNILLLLASRNTTTALKKLLYR